MTKRKNLIITAAVAILFLIGGIGLLFILRQPPMPSVRNVAVDAPLTIGAVGDIIFRQRLPSDTGPQHAAVRDLLQSTSIALANLEATLLEKPQFQDVSKKAGARPFGSSSDATQLAKLGFNVLTLANNHGGDYGAKGFDETSRILDAAGVAHAGAGVDLDSARAPVLIGPSPRRVAVLAVSFSAPSESRATHSLLDIKGRPGVNVIKYRADVQVDPTVYAILKRQSTAVLTPQPSGAQQLSIFGTSIKEGAHTVVDFLLDNADAKEVLDEIKKARQQAEVVVLAMHSHEPRNQSTEPAKFVRDFAHLAIEAGATLIVGSGPHQLRGIEVYQKGAILYSLGNFLFDPSVGNDMTADFFDAGADLFGVTLGSVPMQEALKPMSFNGNVYWESVIAIGKYNNNGLLQSIRLVPIDLGTGVAAQGRGLPRLTDTARGAEILQRLANLSKAFGTHIKIADGTGVVDVAPSDR